MRSKMSPLFRKQGHFFYSVPFLSQEEVADISVLDTISAHVKLIKRNNVLWEVVSDVVIRAKLTNHRFFRCQRSSSKYMIFS